MSNQNEVETQIGELIFAVQEFSAGNAASILEGINAACSDLLLWLTYLNAYERTGTADLLLDGVASSVRECAACAALGFVRPALFSARTQIDLLLGWLYFKDHPVEWNAVNERGEGFKLKRELLDYYGEYMQGYKMRFGLLQEVADRSESDPYRLLSAHIHAQSSMVLPDAMSLKDVVRSSSLVKQLPQLLIEVNEYVGDVLISMFARKWASIPGEIIDHIVLRLNTKKNQRERFFEGI